jgi:hypothetical protein
VFRGKLSVQYQESTVAQLDEEEGAPLANGAVAQLTVSGIAFQGGATFAEEANIALDQCTFGIPHVGGDRAATPNTAVAGAAAAGGDDAVREQRTVRVHAFATPAFSKCRIFGADRSAIYCYPYAKAAFTLCDVVGMVAPPPPVQSPASARRMRAATPTPAPPATAAPAKCLSDAGVHLDDAASTFHQCAVRNFNIGVVTNDACRGSKLSECAVSEIASVGYLLGPSCVAQLRECKGRLCGREALVLGARSHVSMRGCAFSGDVRVKDEAVLSALVDNLVGPEAAQWKVFNEAAQFSDRGFTVTEDDPSARKKRKPPPAEE